MIVNFRLAEPDDASGILAVYAPFCESTYVSFEIVAPTETQMRDRVSRVLASYPWIVGEVDGRLAGYVYAVQHRERAAYRWAVDVAVYVAAEHHRKGLGRALYTGLFEILLLQGYFKAIAGITLPNPSSVGLHESMGFRPVAMFPRIGYKLSRWLDVGWWQLDLQAEVTNPPEPRLFTDIRDHPAVATALTSASRTLGEPSDQPKHI